MTQAVKIIIGFHPCTPRPPRVAIEAGLVHRVAFAMESYQAGSVDMVFDTKLFLELTKAVSSVIAHERTEVREGVPKTLFQRLFGRTRHNVIGPLESLDGFLSKEGAEPPTEILWILGNSPVLVGVAEYWNRVGGPEPYHDTYTFSLFSDSSTIGNIVNALRSAADRMGSQYETIQAVQTPNECPTRRCS